MKPFKFMFHLVGLPLVVLKDVALAIPKSSMGYDPFEDTKATCDELDKSLSGKP